MIKHFFKTIFRNSFRNKLNTLINLFGLSFGIGASLILLLYIQHEVGFDSFHQNKESIYRINAIGQKTGTVKPRSPYEFGPELMTGFPEIKNFCRLKEMNYFVKRKDSFIRENNFIIADSSFFEVFSFNLISGNKESALNQPNTIVLTKAMAEKYFPDENAVGMGLEILLEEKIYQVRVSAVIENFPSNSHIQANFILPIQSMYWGYEYINDPDAKKSKMFNAGNSNVVVGRLKRPPFESWMQNTVLTYLVLHQNVTDKKLDERISEFVKSHVKQDYFYKFELQSLARIHLYSNNLTDDIALKGDLEHIYLFGIIATLILLIAIINYIILATAGSLKRTKEIGLRKVIGANRAKIMKQVLGESLIITFFSLPFALLLVAVFLPDINNILGRSIELSLYSNPIIILETITICLLTGLISGSYIAFYLSSFKPIDVFRSKISFSLRGSIFQKSLIVAQLIIFITLLVCSGIIYDQVKYLLNNQTLGFEKENLITVNIPKENFETVNTFTTKYQALKSELLKSPNIKYVSASSSKLPAYSTRKMASVTVLDQKTNRKSTISCSEEEIPEDAANFIIYEQNIVDFDYIEAMGMQIAEGRSFDKLNRTESRSVIVNEQFIKEFDIKNPLTEKCRFTDSELNIVGIVKNYHSRPFSEKIGPVLLACRDNDFLEIKQLIIKTNGENIKETLTFIESKWKEFCPNTPFEYYFNEPFIDEMFHSEQNLATLVSLFASLAIIIASLGLFGLSLFIAQKKTREIVIRKTMGASVSNIIVQLLKPFFILAILANLIAMPLAYYIMANWLQNFEYQSMMDFRIFVGAGLSSLILCLLTVSFHSAKAAIIKPVEALKYE